MSGTTRDQRTIFLLEEDDDVRPLIRQNLIREGYRVLLALNEEDALDRVSSVGNVNADLILVNLVGKSPEDALKVGRRIREHAKSDGATPLIVMAEKYGKDVEGTNVNVSGNDWITYLEDAEQLRDLLNRLIPATAPDA
jgi:DNA-binding response OmpR family regulator